MKHGALSLVLALSLPALADGPSTTRSFRWTAENQARIELQCSSHDSQDNRQHRRSGGAGVSELGYWILGGAPTLQVYSREDVEALAASNRQAGGSARDRMGVIEETFSNLVTVGEAAPTPGFSTRTLFVAEVSLKTVRITREGEVLEGATIQPKDISGAPKKVLCQIQE